MTYARSGGGAPRGRSLLKLASLYPCISIAAGFFGFSGVCAATAEILFLGAVAVFVVVLMLAVLAGQAVV